MKLPSQASLFTMLTTRLDMLQTRQTAIAENVANATTPGYVPGDVDMDGFAQVLARTNRGAVGVGLAVTRQGHIAGTPPDMGRAVVEASPDSETTLDGNAVVIEEQMLKMNATRTDFETAMGLYRKGLDLIRLASKGPV